MSPITIAVSLEPEKAAHEVRPIAGVTRTPPTDTARSDRGDYTLKTPSFSFQAPFAPVNLSMEEASGRPVTPRAASGAMGRIVRARRGRGMGALRFGGAEAPP